MKQLKPARTTLLVGTVLLLALNSAWASTAQDAMETEQAETAASAMTESGQAQAVAKPAEQVSTATPGMDIPLDGTSLETWNASLEEVKEVGGLKAYGQIQDAFDYLLMFDLGAKNDPATLASRLNGMTGEQILKRVAYRKGK